MSNIKKPEWRKSHSDGSYYVDSWSSDSDKYLLRIVRVEGETDKWIIDVMGLDRFLVIDEVDVENVKTLAKKYLIQVMEEIYSTMGMKKKLNINIS
jgi:hypothetical protein